jgi:hypothetical protein
VVEFLIRERLHADLLLLINKACASSSVQKDEKDFNCKFIFINIKDKSEMHNYKNNFMLRNFALKKGGGESVCACMRAQ